MEHTHRVLSKHMEETSSDEGSRLVANIRRGLREDPDRWLEDHSSGSLWRTSGLAGDAERISAGVEAHTKGPRSQAYSYPVLPPPADPLPPPEDALSDDEQTSEYSEYENDVASVDTDMLTNTGSVGHSEITFLHRDFVPGTPINLNSRRLHEVANNRQTAAVRAMNKGGR